MPAPANAAQDSPKPVVMERAPSAETEANLDLDCASVQAHNISKDGDTTPLEIPEGAEMYRCFYATSPWNEDQQGVSVTWNQAPVKVVHHALLYSVEPGHEPGTVEECAGLHFDGTLLPAWGIEDLPSDTGFHVPSKPGQTLMIEVHYINTGKATTDTTGLKVCVAKTKRPNTASLTWLGTEDIGGLQGIPPRMTSTVTGTCVPGREGLKVDQDIHVLMLVPHMHQLGVHSTTIIHRKSGEAETMLDVAFDYANQAEYLTNVDLHAGDSVETRCTFNNTTDNYVAFGPSLTDEMCYTFAMAYPATTLDHTGISLVGASDTCLW